MTEAEWLASEDPRAMLGLLGGWRQCEQPPKASDRKLRLFACACCRLVWGGLIDERSRQAVEAAERHADGETGGLDYALRRAYYAWGAVRSTPRERVAFTAWSVCATHLGHELGGETFWAGLLDGGAAPADQAALLRCVAGNPFRPSGLSPVGPQWARLGGAWGVPYRLALAIYDGRTFGNLPILADAIEEGGCTDPQALGHLRGPGPHCRGCWVVDLILGKE